MNRKRTIIFIFVFLLILEGITYVYADDYQVLYSTDGRTFVVQQSKVEEYLKVGWYIEPVQNIYAPDGRIAIVEKILVDEYLKVGWYIEPVQKMYSADGRCIVVLKSEAESYNAVGWYYEPVTLMYSNNGRTIYVGNSQIYDYISVGWSTQPFVQHKNDDDEYTLYVYATPTGKRYHLRSTCGGKNSFSITLQGARNRRLTPCKKCAY